MDEVRDRVGMCKHTFKDIGHRVLHHFRGHGSPCGWSWAQITLSFTLSGTGHPVWKTGRGGGGQVSCPLAYQRAWITLCVGWEWDEAQITL